MNNRNKLKLLRLIMLLRIIAWIIFLLFLSTPIYLSLKNFSKNEVLLGAIGLALNLVFYLYLAVRNESKFNNLLECFYFDSLTITMFLVFIAISIYLYFEPIHQKKIERERIHKHIETTIQFLDNHEKKSSVFYQMKGKISIELEIIKKEISPSKKNAFEKEKVSQNVVKIEENIRKIKELLQNVNTCELDILNYSTYPPNEFSFNDKFDNFAKTKRSILTEYNKIRKDVEKIIEDSKRQKESAIFLLEVIKIEKNVEILTKKYNDLETQKDLLKKKITNLTKTNPSFKNFKESSLKLIAFLSDQKALETKIINLRSELNHLSVDYRVHEVPHLLYSNGVNIILKSYWADNIKSKRNKLYSKIKSLSFDELDNINIENYTLFTNWLETLLKKFPREIDVVQMIREQESFLRDLNKLKKHRNSLKKWEKCYDNYLSYKDNQSHISSEIENMDKLPIDMITPIINKVNGKLDSYDFNIYFLYVSPDKRTINAFYKLYKELDISIKSAELIYSGKLLDLKKKTVKLKSNFFKLKSEFDNFAPFQKKVDDYLNSMDSISKYYKTSLKNIDDNLVKIRDRIFFEFSFMTDGYENLNTEFNLFREQTHKLHDKIKRELVSAIKLVEKRDSELLRPPFKYLLDIKMNFEGIQVSRITNEIEKISKYNDHFNFKLRDLKQHSIKVSMIIDNWIDLLSLFEGRWQGTNLEEKGGATITEIKNETSKNLSRLDNLNQRRIKYLHRIDIVTLKKLLGDYRDGISSVRKRIIVTFLVIFMIVAVLFFALKKIIQKIREHFQFKSYLKISKEKAINILMNIIIDETEKVSTRFNAIKVLTQLGISRMDNYEFVKEQLDGIGLRKKRIEKKIFSYLNEELINIERRISRGI